MSYITKYRPTSWGQVIGQDAAVKALRGAIEHKRATTFLLTGPSGVGKTTLARIAAQTAGCKPQDIMEVDAATNTGIDDMRAVTSELIYRPLGDGTKKAVIIDEAHALSKPAIQSLLKILEEPPDWVLWFLCTTEANRILATIKSRCVKCDLKLVSTPLLAELLDEVAEHEGIKANAKVIELCAEAAEGSPRDALSNLAACAEAKDVKEANALLQAADKASEGVELARLLAKGAPWREVQALLRRMKEQELDPEGVRRVVLAYMTTVALGTDKEESAGRAVEIIDAFSTPAYGMSSLVLSVGKAMWS